MTENTKVDGISSGLVAVAWMDYSCDPLVRLSDAEAIIAAKDVEIRQWRVLAHQEHGYVLAENRKQAERIKELEARLHEVSLDRQIKEQQEQTLARYRDDEREIRQKVEAGAVIRGEIIEKQAERIKELAGKNKTP